MPLFANLAHSDNPDQTGRMTALHDFLMIFGPARGPIARG